MRKSEKKGSLFLWDGDGDGGGGGGVKREEGGREEGREVGK